MNQIINTDLNKNKIDQESYLELSNNNKKNVKKRFNIQLILSITAIIIISFCFFYYKISLNSKENLSNLLISNYNITQLYNDNSSFKKNNSQSNSNLPANYVIGIIKIPSIGLSYPIFNGLTDELLKSSPCKFFGKLPSEAKNSYDYNLCIAGHNYNNDKFFSKIMKLKINSEIFILDNSNNTFKYTVFKNYEVKENDFSPIYTLETNNKELTLVTCNNFSGNRIIIKAKIEDV